MKPYTEEKVKSCILLALKVAGIDEDTALTLIHHNQSVINSIIATQLAYIKIIEEIKNIPLREYLRGQDKIDGLIKNQIQLHVSRIVSQQKNKK